MQIIGNHRVSDWVRIRKIGERERGGEANEIQYQEVRVDGWRCGCCC